MVDEKKREIRGQDVVVGTAHLDPKNRMYVPLQVSKELNIKSGEDIVFLRVGGQGRRGSKVIGVTAYPGNILMAKLSREIRKNRRG